MPQPILVLLLFLAATTAQAESCAKQVFGRYCLGGSLAGQLRADPAPAFRQDEGDHQGLVYRHGGEWVYVLAYKGRIYKVVRRYRPGTRRIFTELEGELVEKYGPFEEHNRFPPYASREGLQIAAIRRGDAWVLHRWRPKGQPWRVELSWTRDMDVALAYILEDLDAEQQAAREEGL